MINLLKLTKAYWRGFVGGPDFNRCITHRFLLDAQQLSIKLPDSNVAAAPSSMNAFSHIHQPIGLNNMLRKVLTNIYMFIYSQSSGCMFPQ